MSIEFNENHLREITETSERSKSNSHRLDEMEGDIKSLKEENKTLYEMSASIKSMTDGIVSIKEDVKEIKSEQGEMKSEISDLKNAPIQFKASAFDSAWKFIVTVVATGLISFVLGNCFPQIFH